MIVDHTVGVFLRWPTPPALMWLGCWRRFAFNYALKARAQAAVHTLAAEQRTDLSRLLDGALSAHDADPPRVRRHWGAHLEAACIDGRSWGLSEAQTVFLGTDQRASLSEGLVFALTHSDKRTLVSIDGLADALRSSALHAETRVCLPHPLDLDGKTLSAWRRRMDESPTPVFAQLRRGLDIDPHPAAAIDAQEGPIKGPKLHHGLCERGYEPITRNRKTHSARREAGPDFEIVILHTGYGLDESWVDEDPVTITQARAQRRGQPIGWDDLPTRIAFETARDLLIITGQHREVDP